MIIHLLLSSLNLASVTAGVIVAIAVLLIVVSAIAVIIVIVIVCIIKCNRRKGVPEGNGEPDNTDHYYSLATETALTQPPGIPGEEVYQELDVGKMDDDVTTNKNYQKMNVRTMDPLNYVVMNKRGFLGLDASKRDDDVICSKDYEELDLKMLDKTTNYASLK